MAQLTSVRLRVRADDSIDRRCSTDTAYPFQPHRDQADPRYARGGDAGVALAIRAAAAAAAAAEGRGEKEGDIER